MNSRVSTIVFSSAVLLALLIAAGIQQSRIVNLRAERDALAAASPPIESSAPAAPVEIGDRDTDSAPASPPLELLQLRSQVSQLMQRERELTVERGENERLRGLLSARGTNRPGQPLPAGYIGKSQAQWVGMNTPENTLQSFLYALKTTNVANLLQVVTPRSAMIVTQSIGDDPTQFFEAASLLPGLRIVSREQLPDGSIRASCEMAPGQPFPDPLTFRLIDGQWKLDLLH